MQIFGAVLNGMQLDPSGRVALLTITRETAAAAGGSYDDTEGLINFPLTVKDIQAVAFFKEVGTGRLARQHALEGRGRRRRDRAVVRRRRPHQRRRLLGHRRARRLQETFLNLLVNATDKAAERAALIVESRQ